MKIRVPYTLTADNSDNYEVSIRLWSDGISFSGFTPSERDSFFINTVRFEPDMPVFQSVKNVFFANQCLSYLYSSLSVLCVTERYSLVPMSVWSEKDKDLLFSYCHKKDDNMRVMAQRMKQFDAMMLYDLDSETYEFLSRSLVNPRFVHFMTPSLSLWQKNSLMNYPKQMYVALGRNNMEIACFEQGELLFLNSFAHDTENDVLYYILYACKQLIFNQLDDHVYFVGDSRRCQSIISLIKRYLAKAEYLPVRSHKFLLPEDAGVSFDIIALTECAL